MLRDTFFAGKVNTYGNVTYNIDREIGGYACSGPLCDEEPDLSGNQEYALYWDVSAGFSVFSPEGDLYAGVYALNDQPLAVGSIYTSATEPGVEQGFILDPLSGATTLVNLPPGPADGDYTWPAGINDAGQVVGRYSDNGGAEGGFFLDYTGIFSNLNMIAFGINGVGQIAGNSQNSHGQLQGYVYSKADGYQPIGCSNPLGITNNGQVLCGGGGSGYVYLYDIAHGTTQQVPCSGSCPGAGPVAANDSAVIVGTCTTSGAYSGCYATPNP